MNYTLTFNKKDHIDFILNLMNFNLNLSKLEMKIVSYMLEHKIYILDLDNKQIIRLALDLDKFTFNNYIKRLKDGNILMNKDRINYLDNGIINLVANEELTFKFTINDSN